MCDITRIYEQVKPGVNGLLRRYKPYLTGYVGEEDMRSYALIAIWKVKKANVKLDMNSQDAVNLCLTATRNEIHTAMRTVIAEKQLDNMTVRCDLNFLLVASPEDVCEEIHVTEMKDIVRKKLKARPLIYGLVYDQILNPSLELADIIYAKCKANNRQEKMPATPTIRALAELFEINHVTIYRIVSVIRKEFVKLSSRRHA